MPNWASTEYCFKGTTEQAKDLYEKVDSLSKMKEPLVPNGFGKLWMGCLVNLLGGDCNDVYCRGEIISYKLNGDHLRISCQTAWGEMEEFRHFVEQQYPGSKIYYQVEECGCDVYATNDKEGVYFPDRYVLDYYDGIDYFRTLEDAAVYIGNIIEKKLKPDFTEIEEAIDEYMEEHEDEEDWMSFHQFEVLDD